MPASTIQRQSLVALKTKEALPGKNVYPALVMLGVDGPSQAEREAQVADYVQRFTQWHLSQTAGYLRGDKHAAGEPPSLLKDGQTLTEVGKPICNFNDATTCLAEVRQQQTTITQILQKQSGVVQRVSELSTDGHYHLPLPADVKTPLPSLRYLAYPMAAHALTYLQGDSVQALSGLCHDAAIGRMLMTHSDNILGTVSGAAMLKSNVQVLGSILAELPVADSLPPNCAALLEPTAIRNMSLCQALRGEFSWMDSLMAREDTKIRNATSLNPLLSNREKTQARLAESMGAACLPAAQKALAEDRPASHLRRYLPRMRIECVVNQIGCILTAIGNENFDEYQSALQDATAQLRLLQAIVLLRQQAGVKPELTPQQRLQALPKQLSKGTRSIQLSADGSKLQLPAYQENGKDKLLSLPLPISMTAAKMAKATVSR